MNSCKTTEDDIFKKPPPGTVYIGDSVYIDLKPVTTQEYIIFLKALNTYYSNSFVDSVNKLPDYGITKVQIDSLISHFKGDSSLYKKMLPRVLMTYSSYEKKYDPDFRLSSGKYRNYPIVNIGPKQAKKYCEWRTTMVKLHYATLAENEEDRTEYPLNFKYKIVDRKNWEKALSIFFMELEVNKHSKNMQINETKPYKYQRGINFYYSAVNAGELLENEIVSVDFEWTKSVGLGNISYVKFHKPEDWITFRCKCEILDEEK